MSERQEKRAEFEKNTRRGLRNWIVVGLLVAAAAAGFGWKLQSGSGGKYPQVTASQGRVVLPLEEVGDGRAHFFSYPHDGGTIDFFVLKSRDGVMRAALDTCDVCFRERKGYRQEGDFMVCNNCNQKFRSDRVNEVKGGCNPAPLARKVIDERLVIAAADIEKGARYFPERKL